MFNVYYGKREKNAIITCSIVGSWIILLVNACIAIAYVVSVLCMALLAMAPVPVEHAAHHNEADHQKQDDDKHTDWWNSAIHVA